VAQEICHTAKLSPEARPRNVHGTDAEALYKAIQATKIMAPPSNCISPIGEKAILHGLYKQIKGEFYTAVTRPAAVYRGNPFVIEAGLAFGKAPDQGAPVTADAPVVPLAEGEERDDDSELARVIRYANRVPLLYQQSACATFKAALETAWRNYGVAQSRGALPAGPMVIFVHMGSVWVPFTSESKEAIADYDEIRKEIKLALQECGRRLGMFLRRRERAKSEFRRRNIFELYIEEVVEACGRLKGGKLPKEKLKAQLQKIALKRTGGTRTDAILGHEGGPEGLPDSIIVTADGPEGDAPELPGTAPTEVAPATEAPRPGKAKPAPAREKAKGKLKPARPARATRPAKSARATRAAKAVKPKARAPKRGKKR
jgi:DNA topoisomerase-6 subunit B